MLKGIYTPNVIPFHTDGSINEAELRRYVDWLIGKGISGLYPNGSTGEFIRLSFEERKRVVEIIADENRGRVPILAGAAEANIDLVLSAATHYAELGCTAISVTGPYYYKVSQESIEHYFRELARLSPIDIVLYNIPQFSNEISVEVVRRLALDCPRIVGIKDSSRDMPRFMNTISKIKPLRPDFSCLIGCEEILLPVLLMDGDGGTIATSGVAPEVVVKLYQSVTSGNLAEAKQIQFKILELIETILGAGNFPEGFREGVNLRGFNMGRARQPMSPGELNHFNSISSRLACLLGECGFHEAAAKCKNPSTSANSPALKNVNIDAMVREIMQKL